MALRSFAKDYFEKNPVEKNRTFQTAVSTKLIEHSNEKTVLVVSGNEIHALLDSGAKLIARSQKSITFVAETSKGDILYGGYDEQVRQIGNGSGLIYNSIFDETEPISVITEVSTLALQKAGVI